MRGQPSQPTIFLIHGRDHAARDAIHELLIAIGVSVVTWPNALDELPPDQHDIWRVAKQGFRMTHAAVVILSPDEVAFLSPQYWKVKDDDKQRGPRFQSRPNVLLELGYAIHEWENIIVRPNFRGFEENGC